MRSRLSTVNAWLLAGAVALAAVIVAVIVVVAVPGGSSSPTVFQSWFQDDDHLLYRSPATTARTLDTFKALGVDVVRVTVLWRAIAPDATARHRPRHFAASSPAGYAASAWARYDRLVELAGARGIAVDFNLTAPGPLWAMGAKSRSARYADHYMPSARDFAQFVTAVGRRYDGRYVAAGVRIPRVRLWSIWNEPNQPGWLAPQWQREHGSTVMVSPRLYRAYVDGAFAALRATGHGPGTDTVLIGELAPEGRESASAEDPVAPMPFVRALYCVDTGYRPLRGAAARGLGCPGAGSARRFAASHPGLFDATGFAHHPYAFFLAPAVHMSDVNFVPLADLSRLERGLDAIFRAYGVRRQLPLYLTEYGYETNPPNPFRGVSLRQQSLYLNEAQYLAWRDPRVRALSQFLLYDSPPNRKFPRGTPRYWSTFQTGLLFVNGKPKLALNSYRLPIFIPTPTFHAGRPVLVWGMVRLAPNRAGERAQIQWRPAHGGYRTVQTVATDASGFLSAKIALSAPGAVRIGWESPAGTVFHSRAVGIGG